MTFLIKIGLSWISHIKRYFPDFILWMWIFLGGLLWPQQQRLSRFYRLFWDQFGPDSADIGNIRGKTRAAKHNPSCFSKHCHCQSWSLCERLKPACVCSSQAEFECVNKKKKEKKKGYKNSGIIIVKKCSVRFSVLLLTWVYFQLVKIRFFCVFRLWRSTHFWILSWVAARSTSP